MTTVLETGIQTFVNDAVAYQRRSALWKLNIGIGVVFVSILALPNVIGAPSGIKIGILCDTSVNSWQYLFNIASAISIAKDKLVQNGVIQNDTVTR